MVKYVLTGFGEFHDVPVNPSQVLVRTITSKPMDKCEFRSAIVEVSMEGVTSVLTQLQQCPNPTQPLFASPTQPLTISPDTTQGPAPVSPPFSPSLSTPGEQEIWVHVGVNSQQNGFRLEKVAWNEATFRVPDQRGAQPQNEKIYSHPEALPSLHSTLLLEPLATSLSQLGFPTETSVDPGRFLCNYIYYHSLDYCARNQTHAVFVHVPPFSQQPLDTQLSFMRSLLEILPSFCSPLPPSPSPSTAS